MRDYPIIFSAAMIQALLAGRKTMTRRLLYTERKAKDCVPASASTLVGHPPPHVGRWPNSTPLHYWALSPWQRVKPGDRLWVRENLGFEFIKMRPTYAAGPGVEYVPSAPAEFCGPMAKYTKSRPAIHMPRWASRLTLVVTATKIERLQDIPTLDVRAEGVEVRQFALFGADAAERQKISAQHFRSLWEELHGAGSWDANPELVALSFRVHKQNIDAMKEAA